MQKKGDDINIQLYDYDQPTFTKQHLVDFVKIHNGKRGLSFVGLLQVPFEFVQEKLRIELWFI